MVELMMVVGPSTNHDGRRVQNRKPQHKRSRKGWDRERVEWQVEKQRAEREGDWYVREPTNGHEKRGEA